MIPAAQEVTPAGVVAHLQRSAKKIESMRQELLLSLIVFIGAAVCLGTAIFDWNWAMKSEEAKPVVDLVGRRNTRIFYALLGIGFAGVGVLILTGVLPIPERQ